MMVTCVNRTSDGKPKILGQTQWSYEDSLGTSYSAEHTVIRTVIVKLFVTI